MSTTDTIQLLAAIAGAVSALAAVVAAVFSYRTLRLSSEAQRNSIEAQNRVNAILEEDLRYRTWIDGKITEWTAQKGPLIRNDPANVDEKRYLSRAVREGVLMRDTNYNAFRLA